MSEKNLKLWTCYPKKIENFQDTTEEEDESLPHSYEEASESNTENFTESNNLWSCYTSKEVEGFEAVSESEEEHYHDESDSSIEERVEKIKVYFFGNGPNSDYYFYGSIAAIIFIIILSMRK